MTILRRYAESCASIGAAAPMLALSLLLVLARECCAQAPADVPALLDTTIAAGDADAQEPVKRGLNKYNEFDLGFTTFRIGYGFLVDFATYVQDDESKRQATVESPDVGLRDFRFMFKGRFKTERPLSWTMGVMYDGPTKDWFFRQTGLMVGIPELSSHVFIGRTKESYSQYKYMVGYDIWTMERSPFLDAFVPILGDGIRWTVAMPQRRFLIDLGVYTDVLAEKEKFANYDNQVVSRFVYQPVVSERGKLSHVALMGRIGKPDDGKFQARSRPEAFLAPYFVDTGKFDSDNAVTVGLEAYYRDGPWMFGGEYGWQTMDAQVAGDPMFHGGNLSVSWLVTGETRGYNVTGGFFKAVSPTRTIFEGGPGAVDLALNLSYVDLDAGNLRGGTYWRITPLAKWHLMDYMRVELGYGYGVVDKNDLRGKTHFFQGRLLTAL